MKIMIDINAQLFKKAKELAVKRGSFENKDQSSFKTTSWQVSEIEKGLVESKKRSYASNKDIKRFFSNYS